jgi:DNA-binding NarL/FixJ family response regulator
MWGPAPPPEHPSILEFPYSASPAFQISTSLPPFQPSDAHHPVAAAAQELSAPIKELIEQGLSHYEVARQPGVSRQTITKYVKRMS